MDEQSSHSQDISEGSSSIPQPHVAAYPKGSSPYSRPCNHNSNDRGKMIHHRRTRTPMRDDLHYKLIELAGPAYADRTRCDDAIDPISQQRIWESDKNGHRYPDYSE